MNNRIHISIAFGDAILPVIECEDGLQRVPLKPIAEQIGVDWRSQKRKLQSNAYLSERIGLFSGEELPPQMAKMGYKKSQYLVRIDRVEAFLSTLNPHQIASLGNQEAADWLSEKHAEWDDAIHAYETDGVALKKEQSSTRKDLIQLFKARQAAHSPSEKAAVTEMIHDTCAELGYRVREQQQALDL